MSDVLARAAAAAGNVVRSLEYRDGKLLFYSQDITIPPAGIPRTLDRLIEIAQILLLPIDQLPAPDPAEPIPAPAPAPTPVPPEAIRASPSPE